MADPYEVDDEGTPVGDDPLRRQIEMTLRTMVLSTVIGLIIIAVVAVVVPSIRGVMILVGIVYLGGSLAARWYLKRSFMSRLKGPGPDAG